MNLKTFALYNVSKQFTNHTKYQQKRVQSHSIFSHILIRSLDLFSSLSVVFESHVWMQKATVGKSAYRPIALLHLMLFHMLCNSSTQTHTHTIEARARFLTHSPNEHHQIFMRHSLFKSFCYRLISTIHKIYTFECLSFFLFRSCSSIRLLSCVHTVAAATATIALLLMLSGVFFRFILILALFFLIAAASATAAYFEYVFRFLVMWHSFFRSCSYNKCRFLWLHHTAFSF